MAASGQIDYIEFPATDLERTKKFYVATFGWKFEDYGPDYTRFQDGRLAGGFYSDPQGGARRPLTIIYAADLEASETKVRSAGGAVVKPIFFVPRRASLPFH